MPYTIIVSGIYSPDNNQEYNTMETKTLSREDEITDLVYQFHNGLITYTELVTRSQEIRESISMLRLKRSFGRE